MKHKFTSFNLEGNEDFHDYENIYEVEETQSSERLKIRVSKNQIGLLIELMDSLNPPYFILYVLIVSRLGNKYGRYQSPLLATKAEVIDFLLDYKEYFETDGRHHLWIGTTPNNGTLIFDQHNVIYAYGPLDNFQHKLHELKSNKKEFDFSFPHCHHFHDDNDKFESQILEHWEWNLFPLAENDQYE